MTSVFDRAFIIRCGRFLGIGIVCLFLASGCTTTGIFRGQDAPPPTKKAAEQVDTKELLARAGRSLEAGEWQLAQQIYVQILKESPDLPAARLGLAECYLSAGHLDAAFQVFTALVSVPEVAARALEGQGLAQLRLGHYREAETTLAAAVGKDATLWRAWNGLGVLYDMRLDWANAAASYDKALAAAPKAAVVYNNKGVSLLLQGRCAEAAGIFRRAIDADPQLATARTNLRLALAGEGRYAEALDGTERSSAFVTLNNIGYVALLRGDLAAAEKYLLQAMDRDPSYYEKAAHNLDRVRALRSGVRP